jgi:hypothetical protein
VIIDVTELRHAIDAMPPASLVADGWTSKLSSTLRHHEVIGSDMIRIAVDMVGGYVVGYANVVNDGTVPASSMRNIEDLAGYAELLRAAADTLDDIYRVGRS